MFLFQEFRLAAILQHRPKNVSCRSSGCPEQKAILHQQGNASDLLGGQVFKGLEPWIKVSVRHNSSLYNVGSEPSFAGKIIRGTHADYFDAVLGLIQQVTQLTIQAPFNPSTQPLQIHETLWPSIGLYSVALIILIPPLPLSKGLTTMESINHT